MADKIFTAQEITDSSSAFNAQNFHILQLIGKIKTMTPCLVMPNITGQIPGTVNVQPMVDQMSGDDVPFPHGTIFNIPFFRILSGANAIIVNPQPGDVGVCGFCDRDISIVKKTATPSPPGSWRQYDYADGIYFGGLPLCNPAPTQFIEIDTSAAATGITITSPVAVTINAPTSTINGNFNVNGNTVFTGTVEANGHIIDQTHTHNGVQPGLGTTGVVT